MQEILSTLRSHVDILWEATESRQTGTKTRRLKAVTAINELLSKKSVINALTTASRLEMMKGTQQDSDSESVMLAWAELASIVTDAVNTACMEAANAKSVSRSGVASLKPDHMICLRAVINKAIRYGPSGVIRHITPVFLFYSHQWLSEPSLRSIVSDQIWQLVRELLRDEANRAMLTPPFIRTWVDVCFEQLTGRGPLQRKSEVVTSLASEVLQLLAKPVPSYDILTQSTRGVSTSKMLGGDYSYATICERCCLMLVIADSMSRRDARELQATCFRTLIQLLQNFAVNLVGSAALKSIINVSLKPILSCWTDRRYHDPAVSMARALLLLSPNHRELKSALRRRILADVKDQSSSAVLRAGFDVKDDFVHTVAECFSLAECLNFVKSSVARKGHLTLWLRVTHSIISRKVLKIGASVLVRRKQLESQTRELIVTVTDILRDKLSMRENKYREVILWIARAVHAVCELVRKMRTCPGVGISWEPNVWEEVYQELWNHASRAKTDRLSGGDFCAGGVSEDWFDSLVFSLSTLYSVLIFELSPRGRPSTANEGNGRLAYPLSKLTDNEEHPSSLELAYLRNIISTNGVPEHSGTHLREQMLDRLLTVCEIGSMRCENSAERLINSSCAVLGLSRGACFVHQEPSKSCHQYLSEEGQEMDSLLYLNGFFCMNMDKNSIEGNGPQLCTDRKQQICMWSEEPPGVHNPLSGLYDLNEAVRDSLPYSRGDVKNVHGGHFAVDPEITKLLETSLLSKLWNVLRKSTGLSGDPHGGQSSQRGSGIEANSSEEGFKTEKETLCGVKLVLFLNNYFLQGLELGLIIPDADEVGQGTNAIEELRSLLTLMLLKLSRTNAHLFVLTVHSELMVSVISVSISLVGYIESVSKRKTPSCRVFDYMSLNETILQAIISISRNFGKHMMHLIEERTEQSVKRIETYSSNSFAFGDYMSPRRFNRVQSEKSSARKRRRLSTCLDEEQSFESRFSDEQESDVEKTIRENKQREDKYESSDDDSNEFIQGPAQLSSSGCYLRGDDGHLANLGSTSAIRNISHVIQCIIRQNGKAAEVVFEVVRKGIKKLNDIQLTLSPDGFERSTLLSDLFDDGFLEMRQCLWNSLFLIGTYPALLTAAEDIFNFGKMWKEAEEVSEKYVHLYADSFGIQKRKHYPVPQQLEVARVAYLEYSRAFVLQCGKSCMLDRLRHHLETSDDALPSLLAGIMAVVDNFRSKHAFRMPRAVRSSYLRVGVAFMETMSKCFESFVNPRQAGTKVSDLGKVLNSTKNAVLKFLSDRDGSIRVLAAHFVPRLLDNLHFKTVVDMESFIQSFLPERTSCLDRSFPYAFGKPDLHPEESEGLAQAPWDLTTEEYHAHSSITTSFSHVGSTSKGIISILSLTEAAMVQEAIIPFFYVELFGRVMENSQLRTSAYFAILRLCCTRGYVSPKRAFQLFARVILHRWLCNRRSIEILNKFPVFLTLDDNHHEEGIYFDWMREHQSVLIPYFLIHESQEHLPCLKLLSKLADDLGTSASSLLSSNVPSFSLVYPMHFIDSTHVPARKLWNAIDACVGGNSQRLMSENTDTVMAGLLQSIYTNGADPLDVNSRKDKIEANLGFIRDATRMNPPLYDPLVIALSINQLYKTNPNIFIISRNALKGSIFAEVRIKETGEIIASDFGAFVKECQKKNGTLLHLLLTISKLLVGAPQQQPDQNRRDGFFCVGVLWRMISITVLTKSVSERRIFYMLIARGFEHRETVLDAAWLLLDVQRRVAKLNSDCPSFSLSETDLSSDPDLSEHLSQMTSSQERCLYELLNATSPVLVSLLVCSEHIVSEQQKGIVSNALRRLVSLCVELEAWSAIVANGPFPAHNRLSHVQKLYNTAKTHTDISSPVRMVDRALEGLNRFRGIFKLQRSITSPPVFLACLQELNMELRDTVVSDLSRRVQAEAWVRSCGMEYLTAPRISDVISCTLDLVCTINNNQGVHTNTRDSLRSVYPLFPQAGSSITEFREAILEESASLLSKLGLLNLYCTPISSTKNYLHRIPARSVFDKYEDVQSGIRLSIFLLQDLLTSGAPVRGLAAFETLREILQTKEGRSVLEGNRNCFEGISFLRSSYRGVGPKIVLATVLHDPLHGDNISADDLPSVTDVELWSRSSHDFTYPNGLDKWVRTFCAAFARVCQSKELRSLSSACFASYEVSCQMMPYLLMDSICDFDTERLSIVGDLLSTHVLSNPKAPRPLRRLFIYALDVLCQIGLAVAFKDGISHWFQKTDRTYPCYYVFDIPYEQVAAAALESKAYFSAIRFAQLYINQEEAHFEFCRSSKAKREKLSISDEDSLLQRKLSEAQSRIIPIVREAMNHISEPDSKTAFNSGKNLTTLVANVAGFNNEWATALGALEVSNDGSFLDDMSVGSESQNVRDSRIDFALDLNREVQKFKCFIGMGTLKVACAYWEELRRRLATVDPGTSKCFLQKHGELVQQLNDMRYAVAWKLQQWESPKVLSTQEGLSSRRTSARKGFHEAIHSTLYSLCGERYADVSETLIDGRNSLLSNLVEDTASVSASGVYRLATQLKVLEFLDRRNFDYAPNVSVDAPFVLQGKGGQKSVDGAEPILRHKSSISLSTKTGNGPCNDGISRVGKPNCDRTNDDLLLRLMDIEASLDEEKFFPLLKAFDNSILTAEIPAVLYRCLRKKSNIALAAAATSTRVLYNGGAGCWARAASCLGTLQAAFMQDAEVSKIAAWKLQDARLRWYSNHDACSRRQALDTVKNLIFNDLCGKSGHRRSDENEDEEVKYHCIVWLSEGKEDQLLHFLRVEACNLAAIWSLDMRTDEPMDLYKLYLESGLSAAQQTEEHRTLTARAHLAMASFANEQIRNIDMYKKSKTYEQLFWALKDTESKVDRMKEVKEGRLVTRKRLKLNKGSRASRSQMNSGSKLSRELDTLIRQEEKKARIERERLNKLDRAYRKWQLLACKHFAACLRAGTGQDLRVAFRMVAIWLDSGAMRDAITAALISHEKDSNSRNKGIDVPVSKLLPLAPQLISRLNFSRDTVPDLFQNVLTHTIISMASDFPAHCLWQLLALTNSTIGCDTEKYAAFYRGDEGKKEAAEDILKRLPRQFGSTVSEMKKVSDAYIALSEIEVSLKSEGKRFDLRAYSLLKLGELRNVPIPTIPLPILANDHLDPIPSIHSFERYATAFSGLSRPLRIICIGSDGHRYPQLVKGRDDLRGDAVMEQMFMIVNKLLQRDDKAAARKLSIRTYRIIPLSPFSGIIQFVDNTKQLKGVLIEKSAIGEHRTVRKSLHERYRPKDLKYQVILGKAFQEYKHDEGRNIPRLKKYLRSAWPKFQPVFRHFFIEQWPDPEEWFQHQLNYSRSVAVMSIVGFIIGLGDRHLSNILMDVRTAEVVHIDFGISFELGKLLPTPELMPFRLTRDIVDGFGIAGVEGVFRRCCEITLQVLRQNKDVLLTVIDVLLHDPMFTWALTPVEILKEQEALEAGSIELFEGSESSKSLPESAVDAVARKVDRDVNGSRDAQRAMSRISEKLDGLEGTERLSVEAHVARLIDEARAFHVVGAVFPGWSPWV